ncbi:hypothetical protein ACGFIY_21015 [Micromonospora chersina]|uniref:hypothetical protein n=1 Tax=Micromonospora chersina TaxID=47854 RepID=UPI00371FB330
MKTPAEWADLLVIPLAEVAKRTGWSKRSLEDDCRAGAIDHINRKGSYGFTHEQLDALLARYTRKGSGEEPSAAEREADELAAARAYNAQTQSRSGGTSKRAA